MKKKKYIVPKIESIGFSNESCLLANSTSTNKLKWGEQYSGGEQYSQGKEQKFIWDEMDEE